MWAATVKPSCLPGVKGYKEPGFGAMHKGMCVQRDVTEWQQRAQGWVLVCGYGLKWGWVSPVLGRQWRCLSGTLAVCVGGADFWRGLLESGVGFHLTCLAPKARAKVVLSGPLKTGPRICSRAPKYGEVPPLPPDWPSLAEQVDGLWKRSMAARLRGNRACEGEQVVCAVAESFLANRLEVGGHRGGGWVELPFVVVVFIFVRQALAMQLGWPGA